MSALGFRRPLKTLNPRCLEPANDVALKQAEDDDAVGECESGSSGVAGLLFFFVFFRFVAVAVTEGNDGGGISVVGLEATTSLTEAGSVGGLTGWVASMVRFDGEEVVFVI